MSYNIIEFLLSKGYFVGIHQENTNLYHVSFPSNSDLNIQAQSYQYFLLKNDELIVTRLNDKKIVSINVEDYELRPIFMTDIFVKSQKRKIPPSLIVCTNQSDKIDKLFNLLPVPQRLSLETHFLNFTDDYLTGKKDYSIIEKYNLQSSFDKFINIYDNGGIL